MSTRAVYTFIDSGTDQHHVYKHHDGYPSGAVIWIRNALSKAWKLPRFEADEFAASFVAANKDSAGGIRLTNHYDRHGDLEYRYEISTVNGELQVTAFVIDCENPIFKGTLTAFEAFASDK